jgi:glycosyltransferase involved in cell wall biosynthesis
MLVGAIGNYELESLAAGVPVVTHFNYRDAYPTQPPIVEAANPEDAAGRIRELLDDEAARARIASDGPGWVDANHSAPSVALRVLADYRRTGQSPD